MKNDTFPSSGLPRINGVPAAQVIAWMPLALIRPAVRPAA